MTLRWIDATYYTPDEKPDPTTKKIAPRLWSAKLGSHLSLSVTKQDPDHKGVWIFNCEPLFIHKPLNLPSVALPEAAMERAEEMLRDVLSEMVKGICK
jgi:hypothetical protein